MTAMTRFVPTRNYLGGGSLGYIECSYAQLVKAFGKPNGEADDYKTSTEWHILDTGTNAKLAIYDYKETELYSRSLPSVKAFRAKRINRWHVGGMKADIELLAQFISEASGKNVNVPPFRGF